VYEFAEPAGEMRFQLNAQICGRGNSCDIEDPSHNTTWVTPDDGGGPNCSIP
jgi:hypothetical protein